jgi:transposase
MQIHYEETVMRFVPIKSPEQHAELAVHRIRQRLMGERIALINQLRGLLAEFGLVLAPGANHVRSKLLCGIRRGGGERLSARGAASFDDLICSGEHRG